LVLPLNSQKDEDIFLSDLVIEEKEVAPGETVIGITAPEAGHFMCFPAQTSSAASLEFAAWSSLVDSSKKPVDLHFIPYFARANRGGKGMMRVGIRTV
jgi:hypothetical protein